MHTRRSLSEGQTAMVLVAPAFLLIFALGIVPVVCVIVFSLGKVQPALLTWSYMGLDNYAEVLKDSSFWSSLGITLYFTVVSVLLQLVIGSMIAMLLNQEFRGRWLVRTLAMLPWAVPTVVNANLWKWILNANYGVLNKILMAMGIIEQDVLWLNDPNLALNLVVLVDTWRMLPLVFLMLLAALQTVSQTLVEAARVDGAGAFKRFFHVYLPGMKPMILVVLVLRTIQAFKVFDVIYTMTKGGPNNGTMTISFFTYYEIYKYLNYGKGAAISLIILVIMLAFTALYKRLLRTDD